MAWKSVICKTNARDCKNDGEASCSRRNVANRYWKTAGDKEPVETIATRKATGALARGGEEKGGRAKRNVVAL